MDTIRAIIEALYARIMGDPVLQALAPTGELPLYEIWAPEDAGFPYLTHEVRIEITDVWALVEGTWRLDIWDHSQNRNRLYAIRARLVALMDQETLTLPVEVPTGVRVVMAGDGPGPTDSPEVQRQMMAFGIWYGRTAEITAILA